MERQSRAISEGFRLTIRNVNWQIEMDKMKAEMGFRLTIRNVN